MNILETPRIILRTWQTQDALPYFQINQDPKVIEFLMGSLSMEAVELFIQDMNTLFEKHSYTLFAAEEKSSQKLMGFIGLKAPSFESHFTPAVEIGWRLGSEFWGRGLATEGARCVLNYGFNLGLKDIVSFTVPNNHRSIRVMEKLGMHRNPQDDFLHPKLDPHHPLAKHVLYRIHQESF